MIGNPARFTIELLGGDAAGVEAETSVTSELIQLANITRDIEKDLARGVAYDASLCAHARSRVTGCTRCLDVCPTGAITPDGDHVAIDPVVCAGCGSCASVCPTGAASYQLPAGDGIFQRLRTLLGAYRQAGKELRGGEAPVLLLHDTGHGAEMVSLMARHGRGLPGRVLPFPVNETTQVGLDFLAAAFAYGTAGIAVLTDPAKRDELAGLAQQIALTETVLEGLGHGGGRIHLIDTPDPEAAEAALRSLDPGAPPEAGQFLPLGGKRTRTLLALRHLHETAPAPVDRLPLPPGAPFGAVEVDTEGCTLCLACVGACPTGALLDDQDRPWLGFQEEACVQCGLCRATCPESVITLAPRLDFTDRARSAAALNEAEPFHCIRCGRPFGVQRTIEKVAEKLADNWMFQGPNPAERIMMCDDCRVVVEFERPDSPLAGPARPAMRTTDDYLREREIEEARAKVLAERAGKKGDD